MNQRGQLAELLTEDKPLDQVTVDDLLTIYERKASCYCYSFPLEVGLRLAGHSPDIADAPCFVLLAQQDVSDAVRAMLAAEPPLSRTDSERLRAELWSSPVPVLALRLCEELLSDIRPRTSGLPLGAAASEYLDDLIQHRLEGSVGRLRWVLNTSEGSGPPG